MSFRPCGCVVAAVLFHATVVAAQPRPRYELSLLAGPSSHQLSGTGTTFAIGLTGAVIPVSPLYVEVSMTYFDCAPQFEERFGVLAPPGISSGSRGDPVRVPLQIRGVVRRHTNRPGIGLLCQELGC